MFYHFNFKHFQFIFVSIRFGIVVLCPISISIKCTRTCVWLNSPLFHSTEHHFRYASYTSVQSKLSIKYRWNQTIAADVRSICCYIVAYYIGWYCSKADGLKAMCLKFVLCPLHCLFRPTLQNSFSHLRFNESTIYKWLSFITFTSE